MADEHLTRTLIARYQAQKQAAPADGESYVCADCGHAYHGARQHGEKPCPVAECKCLRTLSWITTRAGPPDEYPLPWRWGVGPGEDPRERPNLLDANGAPLISRASGCTVASSYVRAVTERAKALEQVVRYALPILARAHDLPADLVPGPVYGAGRALIAQIDAAKEEERDG